MNAANIVSNNYTIFSSGNGITTLIWVDEARIRSWYFIQEPWYMDGHTSRERYWFFPKHSKAQ